MNSSHNLHSPDLRERIRQLEEQVEDFENLNAALETIWSATGVEEVLKRIIEAIMQVCRAGQCSIVLLGGEDEGEARTLIRGREAGKEVLDKFLHDLLVGWVCHHREPLLTENLSEVFGKANIKEKYAGIASVLSFPLISREKIIGVINLISGDETRKFGERELRLMRILASQCAQFIRNARLQEELFDETRRLKKEVLDKYALYGIIGRSPEMRAVFSLLERVIPTDVQVLLEGESGTDKERIARAIHYNGPRQAKPFVAVDCGALPASLLESELFGYAKGAFTGAQKDRKGLFEEAHGGTLFLDEIANMPPEIQAKFLRAIQEGEIRPLGTSQMRKVDVRIIAAASGNLQDQVEAGKFRQDLFYRLNVVRIALPPLRKRKEDITILTNHFLRAMNEKYHKRIKGFNVEIIPLLEAYPWPGNVRELEHAVERAVVLCDFDQLSRKDFSFLETSPAANEEASPAFSVSSLHDALNAFKKEYIERALKQTGGHQKKAAEILNIQRTYLNRLIKELKIED